MKRRKKVIFGLSILVVMAAVGFFIWQRDPEVQQVAQITEATQPAEAPVITEPVAVAPAPVAPAPPVFSKSKYSLTDPKSVWVIANKQRPLSPLTYAPSDLVSVGNGHQMRREAATALTELRNAASATGRSISPLSGYRSYSRQQTVYQNIVNTYGQAEADISSAKPGHSEHQTGWAIDVGGGGCGIEDCFGNTSEGKWLALNAYKYGFIIRYPQGKQDVTGYKYEPWHIRYVGKDLSAEMQKKGIVTLEEFFGL